MNVTSCPVIAMRELNIDGDSSKKIRVEILQPERTSHGVYFCEVRIEGAPADLTNVRVAGVDSYQALSLAFRTAANAVDVYNKKYCDSKLRWKNQENLELHFTTVFEE